MRTHIQKFISIFFAFILLVGLLPTTLFTHARTAFAATGITVTTTVDDLNATLPVLTDGVDFTAGQPVNADPVNYTDANGKQPLAELQKQKKSEGLSLVWKDSSGAAFDWSKTKVTKSTVVHGTWEPTQCDITLVYDNDSTSETTVTIPWGQSYSSVAQAPTNPTRKGWTFLGWFDAAGNQFDFNAPVKDSTTVTAKWSIADVKVVPTTNPESGVPKQVTGTCYIGDAWDLDYFAVSNFSGYLAGVSGVGTCADYTAAMASYTTATYVANLVSVDMASGTVVYDVMITPPGVTDGVTRNQFGLIGYQRVHMTATLKKNFGGWIEISKSSSNPEITNNNSCYSLEGAEFVVYDSSNRAVAKLTTNANGYVKSDLLPSGNYSIKETKAPKGYALNSGIFTCNVTSGNTTKQSVKDIPQNDPVGVLLGKYDSEKTYNGDKNLPLGSAKLYGAQYSFEYYDGFYNTESEAKASGKPTRSWILQTNENGIISFAGAEGTFDVHDADGKVIATLPYKVSGDDFYKPDGIPTLPLGTLVVKETKAPEGYNLPKPFGMEQSYVRQITSDGVLELVKSYNTPQQAEPVKRSDLTFTKSASDDQHSLAGVPFKITLKSTGESHVVVTDANGKVSTKSSWNAHTTNTNGNDWYLTKTQGNVIEQLLDTFSNNKLDATAGVWFSGLQKGDTSTPAAADDERGALVFGEYELEELPCDANAGYQLIKKTFTVERDSTFNADNAVDLGTLTDQDVSISTSAYDKNDNDQIVVAEPDTAIVDKVSCDNLSKNTQYVVNGTLINKVTGKPYVDATGKEVTGSTTFTAKSQEQDVYVGFEFDGSNLTEDTELVVFETIATRDDPDRILAEHQDINDQGQTITVQPPKIGTIALDGIDNDKKVTKDTQMVINDSVAYVGLSVNREYTLTGTLMNKETNQPIVDATTGKEVTVSKTFKPETSSGTVSIEFAFDGSDLADGNTLVAFEAISYKDKQIVAETDIESVTQSVTVDVPTVATTAKDILDNDKSISPDDEATIVDEVSYKNVVAGKEYTLVATLMDKTTGEVVLDSEGNPVTGSTTFTPDDRYGTVKVSITFDCLDLIGHDLVVFESLQRNGKEITDHADIEDEGQTVSVVAPSIGTTATDNVTGNKNVIANHVATVIDTVHYKGLVPGKEYVASGVLMDKSTNAPLIDPSTNKEVTGSTTFTPDSAEGDVKVIFSFDASALAGRELVAFESVTRLDKEIGSHTEITDESQTVTVVPTRIGTTAFDTADGDNRLACDPESSITDTIKYQNVIPGDELTAVGILMDKNTKLPLLSGEGSQDIDPQALKKFTEDLQLALGVTGETTVTIEIDGVVFGDGESISINGDGSYSYGDSENGATLSKTDDGYKLVKTIDGISENAEMIDADKVSIKEDTSSVAYPIKPNYEAISKLMQENADIVNCLSIQKKSFTPESCEGTVDVEFPLNSIYNEDSETVVFEFLFKGTENDSELIAQHTDFNDEGQTVEIVTPKIATTATDKTDGDHTLLPSREACIIDHVEYTDLIPGKEYTISGVLMDKATNAEVVVGDSKVTAETTFTPNSPDGFIALEFIFDASSLGGKELVVFETIYKDGIKITDHTDINDQNQTVTISPIVDNGTGSGYDQTGVDMTWLYIVIALLVALGAGAGLYAYRQRKLAKAPSESTDIQE